MESINDIGIDEIKIISEITGNNFIKSKNILSTVGELIYKGKAYEVKIIVNKMKGSKINYKIMNSNTKDKIPDDFFDD